MIPSVSPSTPTSKPEPIVYVLPEPVYTHSEQYSLKCINRTYRPATKIHTTFVEPTEIYDKTNKLKRSTEYIFATVSHDSILTLNRLEYYTSVMLLDSLLPTVIYTICSQ